MRLHQSTSVISLALSLHHHGLSVLLILFYYIILERAFSYKAPAMQCASSSIRNAPTLGHFKKRIKNHLFDCFSLIDLLLPLLYLLFYCSALVLRSK